VKSAPLITIPGLLIFLSSFNLKMYLIRFFSVTPTRTTNIVVSANFDIIRVSETNTVGAVSMMMILYSFFNSFSKVSKRGLDNNAVGLGAAIRG